MAIALVAGCHSHGDDLAWAPVAQPAAAPQPAASPKPGLHAYLYQENKVIDGPSVYWLVAVPPDTRATKALWCHLSDDTDEILRIDGQGVQYLTSQEIAAYFSGGHGWPVHLRLKPKDGPSFELDCFDHP